MASETVDHGTIHGRFQPFHRGHLRMARLALDRCEELTVGLTNPDPDRVAEETSDRHRHRPENNPMTFWERYRLVRGVFLEDGVPAARFTIVPFDVNHMDSTRWDHYMPRTARWFLRVKGEWGEEKVRRLERHGLTVERLPFDRYTDVSGTDIRRSIVSGDEDWTDWVPPPGVKLLRSMGIPGRLRDGRSAFQPRQN